MFATNLKRLNLATETYVDTEIDANIPSGTVTSLTASTGLSVVGGEDTITNSGTILLDADLNDLNDVEGTPLDNQVLGWDATTSTWKPMTFTGTGTSSVQWDSLTNVQPLTGSANYIMKVNSSGNAVELIQNRLLYAPNLISGEGLTHSTTPSSLGETVRIDTKLSEISTTPNSDGTTTMVIVDSDGNQRRVQFSNVSLGSFSNDVDNPYLRSDGISAVDPVAFDPATTTFSLTQNRFEIDFDVAETIGITGVLPVESGGTSGSTSEEARENLGLKYNFDIMAYTDPEYINTMKGNDILIRPNYLKSQTLTINDSGSGYVGGEAQVLLDNGESYTIDITTGASGDISTAVAQNTSGYNFLDWSGTSGSVVSGSGVDGEVTAYPQTGYINFGQQTGYSGYGIGYDGEFWFKSESTNGWLNNIPFSIQDANNVESTPSSTAAGVILVYDGVSEFTFQEMNGDVTINRYGTTSISTGAINPSALVAYHDSVQVTVDSNELGTLHDINTTSTIQEQLDEKIGVTNPGEGDMAYYDGSSWQVLDYPTNQNYVLTSTGLSAPVWNYVSTTYEPSSNYAVGDSVLFLDDSSGVSVTHTIEMDDILRAHCGSSGGMAIPGTVLSTDLSILPDVTNFNVSDFYMVVNNPNIADPLDERIGVSEFLSYATGNGLVHSSGLINLDTETDIIPGTDVTYDLGSTTYSWNRVYLQHLNLSPYNTLTAYTASGATPEEGEVIYIRDDTGAGGDPCLGVYTASGWSKVNFSSF